MGPTVKWRAANLPYPLLYGMIRQHDLFCAADLRAQLFKDVIPELEEPDFLYKDVGVQGGRQT